jgi:hypothetical protein
VHKLAQGRLATDPLLSISLLLMTVSRSQVGGSAMGKFVVAIISGVIATVIGGLILNQLQGKGRRRGDVPAAAHLVASLPLERATPIRLRPQ